MKKLLLASIAFAALIAPALAADKPVRVYKRPVVVAAPVYSWTGFYIGGNVGYGWGNARTDIAGSASLVTFPNALGQTPGFPGFPSSYAFADSNSAHLNGVFGGGQVGYNYQFRPNWVLGLEADFQGSGERGSGTFVDPFSTPIVTGFVQAPGPVPNFSGVLQGTAVSAYQTKIDWFGTVRGRLGWLAGDQLLIYGTGGLAYGRLGVSGNTIITETGTGVNGGAGPNFAVTGGTPFGASKTSVGFAVGAGVEGRRSYWLPAGWTWKVEYLYVDLGSLDTVTPFGIPATAFPLFPFPNTISAQTGTITTHTHFTDNIVRVGLNYKFGNYYAPVVTK